MIPTNENLLSALDEKVYGHLEAKKALITLLSRSRMRHYQKYGLLVDKENLLTPLKVLLIGPSGTGKTLLIESLRELYPFPLVRIDATHLNVTGGGGGIKPADISKLVKKACEDQCYLNPHIYPSIEGAVDRTIIFIDELDKLGTAFDSSGNWNQHVQSNFLTIFDSKLEYAGVSFVFAGVFEKLYNNKIIKNNIGFNTISENNTSNIDKEIINHGIMPELVGRISSIVKLDVFTEKMFYDILINTLVPQKQKDLAQFRIFNIEINDSVLRQIAAEAFKSEQGVRYMQRELNRMCIDLEFTSDVDNIIMRGLI